MVLCGNENWDVSSTEYYITPVQWLYLCLLVQSTILQCTGTQFSVGTLYNVTTGSSSILLVVLEVHAVLPAVES